MSVNHKLAALGWWSITKKNSIRKTKINTLLETPTRSFRLTGWVILSNLHVKLTVNSCSDEEINDSSCSLRTHVLEVRVHTHGWNWIYRCKFIWVYEYHPSIMLLVCEHAPETIRPRFEPAGNHDSVTGAVQTKKLHNVDYKWIMCSLINESYLSFNEKIVYPFYFMFSQKIVPVGR